MLKPAHASGTLSTPPSLQYSVSWWVTSTAVSFGYYTYTSTPISCSASSIAGLEPCVAAVAGGPVGFYTYDGNYTGGNPGGFTDAVASHIGCPANSTGTVTCTCNDPYMPDSTATSCVPVPVVTCAAPSVPDGAGGCACNPPNRINSIGECTACPVDPLTKLTDPVAIDFDNGSRWRPDGLTPAYQAHLACVEDAITARGGTYVGTSAYRPTQYQLHLYEIIHKDVDLFPGYMTSHPECQALRDEITREMGPRPGHGLTSGQKVATPGTSRHELGTAFDLTPNGLTDAQLAPIYSGCSVSHTAVSGEPWHTQ